MFRYSSHNRRFLDFLKARPSQDWLVTSLGYLRRSSITDPSLSAATSDAGRRRFRVPFDRRINWHALGKQFKDWIKNPVNIAFSIWLLAVLAAIFVMGLLITGILNGAIPSSSRRMEWKEAIGQILNALCTLMCIYRHPMLFHHLVLLLRWEAEDRVRLRQAYCKEGAIQVYERAHVAFLLVLLHIACFIQYALIGLYWGFNRHTRPRRAETICVIIAISAPTIAGIYTSCSPLGRKRGDNETNEETRPQATAIPEQNTTILLQFKRSAIETNPEWVGGLFDCWDDLTVFYLSFFCTCCVFGWNMERLGFGNMYVHIATFLLLVVAPFWVFNMSALNIGIDTIRSVLGICGIVVAVFGLLYGGFWRIQMRKKFKLPPNPFFLTHPAVSDCVQWLFCWSCSLSQEVRTGNFYDVEDGKFHRPVSDHEDRPALLPLSREGGSGSTAIDSSLEYTMSRASCFGPVDLAEDKKSDTSVKFSSNVDGPSTSSGAHEMKAPIPLSI